MTTNPKRVRRIEVRYRRWSLAPFIRPRPLHIGHTRLYTIGPLAVFIHPTKHKGHRA